MKGINRIHFPARSVDRVNIAPYGWRWGGNVATELMTLFSGIISIIIIIYITVQNCNFFLILIYRCKFQCSHRSPHLPILLETCSPHQSIFVHYKSRSNKYGKFRGINSKDQNKKNHIIQIFSFPRTDEKQSIWSTKPGISMCQLPTGHQSIEPVNIY